MLDPVREVTLSLELRGAGCRDHPTLGLLLGVGWSSGTALEHSVSGPVLPQALVLAPAPEGALLESCQECTLSSQSRAGGDPSAAPLPWGLGGV